MIELGVINLKRWISLHCVFLLFCLLVSCSGQSNSNEIVKVNNVKVQKNKEKIIRIVTKENEPVPKVAIFPNDQKHDTITIGKKDYYLFKIEDSYIAYRNHHNEIIQYEISKSEYEIVMNSN